MSLSNTAKILRAYMQATGISCAKTLADTLGIKIRTIQRLKLDIACATDGVPQHTDATSATCATGGVSETANSATSATDGAATCANDATGGACISETALARVEDNNKLTSLEDNSPKLDSPLSAPQAEKRTSKTKSSKRGTRLANDFELPDDWAMWTRTNCPGTSQERVRIEGLKFANHWQSQPGSRACKLDWFKTWQNWCLKEFATAPTRPSQNSPSMDWREANRQKNREFMKSMGMLPS